MRTILRTVSAGALAAVVLGIAAPPAGATTAAPPSATIDRIFLGRGIVASVDVAFTYSCNAATDRIDVTLTSGTTDPTTGGPTVLKRAHDRQGLECDGARHHGFVEWVGEEQKAFGTDTAAKATAALYDKDGALQAPVVEKTMKPGYGVPPLGN
ncbi:hypothetical protein J7E99_35115 [Streptomyces sp. ISL-44]|uniref:hypothetical protein n=1 Tax=Streptomyces sp. ISL-44 TaxID=2819184 RepID=UPI001BE8863F|nr:hypothetical protein [Streptomyces sp. ISL-44]MBT2545771.1 hypothetical protein [Streptomyces sp. ISL-44]